MSNYKPWDEPVLQKITETYVYEPALGHIYNRNKQGRKPLGYIAVDKSVMLNTYLLDEKGERYVKGLAAHRVAVYLHTGRQPDNIMFRDRDRTNIKWDNLILSTGQFRSVVLSELGKEDSVYMEMKNMTLTDALRHAAIAGGLRNDDVWPEALAAMQPIELYRWAVAGRFLMEGQENPANRLAPEEFRNRYEKPVTNQPSNVPLAPAPVQAKVESRPVNWNPPVTEEEWKVMSQEERQIFTMRKDLSLTRGATKTAQRKKYAAPFVALGLEPNWEQFEEIIKYLPE